MSQAGGDVGGAVEAEQADRGVAQGGHHVWAGAGADLGAVLVEGDVPDPVGSVLDAPVALNPRGENCWRRGEVVGGGDHVDDLDVLLARPRGVAPANVIHAGAVKTLIARWVRRPWPVWTVACEGTSRQGRFLHAA